MKSTNVAVCLVFLMALAMMSGAQAVSCQPTVLLPCVNDAKTYNKPSSPCCKAIGSLGTDLAGATCLCNLLHSSLAALEGVNPAAAIGMPHRCGITVPYHSTCRGVKVPGGW